MIRGSIEVVTHEIIQGWIYSPDAALRGRRVLAFAGADCVGSGTVETFREDLLQAGLGDGYSGYSFGITVDPGALDSVTVRLEDSDAVLLQAHSVVTRRAVNPRLLDSPTVAAKLAALAWAVKRARLSQTDYDYLRLLWSAGVYERSLVHRPEAGKPAVADPPLAVTQQLIEAYLGGDADLSPAKTVTAATFRAELAKVKEDASLVPIVALHSHVRVVLRALEGSHITDADHDHPRRGAYVDYKLGPESVLVVDARSAAELYCPVGIVVSLLTARAAL